MPTANDEQKSKQTQTLLEKTNFVVAQFDEENKLEKLYYGTVEFQICFNFLLVLRRNFSYF